MPCAPGGGGAVRLVGSDRDLGRARATRFEWCLASSGHDPKRTSPHASQRRGIAERFGVKSLDCAGDMRRRKVAPAYQVACCIRQAGAFHAQRPKGA